jgi:hypothetical protein
MTTLLEELKKAKTYTFQKISKYTYNNSEELFDGFTPLFTFTIYYNQSLRKDCSYCWQNRYRWRSNFRPRQNSCYCDNPEYIIGNIVVSCVGNPIKTKPDETIYKIDFMSDFCYKLDLNNFNLRTHYFKDSSNNYIYKKTIFSIYNSMDENDEISKKLVDEIFNFKYAEYIRKEFEEHYDLNYYGNFFQEFSGIESREKYFSCFIDIINNILNVQSQTETKENPHIGMKKKLKFQSV